MTTARIVYEEEHAMLREEARRWLAEHSPVSELRRLSQGPIGHDVKCWEQLAEIGWAGLLVEESYGGAGLGAVDAAVLAEESGRVLLSAPLLATQLASALLQASGSAEQRARWLPAIASGQCSASIAHVGADGGWHPVENALRCDASGRVRGELHHVWGAASAGLVLAPVETPDGVRFAVFEPSDFEVDPEVGLDPSRRQGRVQVDATPAPAAVLPVPATEAWAGFLPLALTCAAAEMAGGADALLVMTAEYAATREQFGHAIGSFQAIKHPLVDVLLGVEQLRSLVYGAATAVDAQADDALRLARMAKAHASDVYPLAASRAIQFHGGYGFTEDCDAHLYLRRAQCMRPVLGDARHHRAEIAAEWLGPIGAGAAPEAGA